MEPANAVLEADGGTRTLSITGGFIALCDAIASIRAELPADRCIIERSIAAISVGIVDGASLLDLDYGEDSRADVDFNVVGTDQGTFVEVQGTAEGRPFDRAGMDGLIDLASWTRALEGAERAKDQLAGRTTSPQLARRVLSMFDDVQRSAAQSRALSSRPPFAVTQGVAERSRAAVPRFVRFFHEY